VNGKDIEGSAVWTKKGKIKKSFAFCWITKKRKNNFFENSINQFERAGFFFAFI
jgi:hypothetical protein